jgi:hypothetical protein
MRPQRLRGRRHLPVKREAWRRAVSVSAPEGLSANPGKGAGELFVQNALNVMIVRVSTIPGIT